MVLEARSTGSRQSSRPHRAIAGLCGLFGALVVGVSIALSYLSLSRGHGLTWQAGLYAAAGIFLLAIAVFAMPRFRIVTATQLTAAFATALLLPLFVLRIAHKQPLLSWDYLVLAACLTWLVSALALTRKRWRLW
jgi:hypothetical protein